MYCQISPFTHSFDQEGLTYFVPDFLVSSLQKGQVVEIPFRDKIELGVVLDIYSSEQITIDPIKIKSIISIKNDLILISNYQIQLIFWIAQHYFSQIHHGLNLFLPKNVKDKISKGKLDISKTREYNYKYNIDVTFSNKQSEAYQSIIHSSSNKILFYGLTGSGKTEIYIKLIHETIQSGKQALFLIPEIVLTHQLSIKLQKVFGDDIFTLSSTVTDANKTKYWLDIYSGNAKIIIGTRSTLFYPFQNLGLIIIDEEQDNSYISDNAPRYNSIEVANKISDLTGAKLILASGTPSIKNMYGALKGEYTLISLLERFGE